MIRNKIRVAATGVTAGIVVAGGLVLGASGASAATLLGTLTTSPPTGSSTTNFNLLTSAACPAGSNVVNAVLNTSDGNFTDIDLVGATTNGVSTTGPMSIPISDNLSNTAGGNSLTLNPGRYDITLFCRPSSAGAASGEFDGHIFLTRASGVTTGPATLYQFTDPAAPTPTNTLTVSPPTSAAQGANVTLTSTIGGSGTNTGTVQFVDGSTNLGTPQTVTGGVATFSTSTLASGPHSFTAVYSGDQGTQPKTSAAVSYNVVGPAQSTTVSLSGAATVEQNQTYHVTVTTTPANSAGTVTLKEGSTTLGTAAITNGSGATDVTFTTLGSHSIDGSFAPSGNFTSSTTTAPLTVNVTAPVNPTASETIETTIAGGSLTISVADLSTVVLPTPVLDTAAGVLVTNGDIHPVTVTDTRAGAPGFTVSGQVTDFTNGAGDKINGFDLGWTPSRIDASAGMNITPGPHVEAAPGAQPGATPSDPTLGLKVARTMATNDPGGLGTTHLGANVQLHAPTNTKLGTYDATLTLTAI